MKKFLFLFLFLCPVLASAQDVIVKKDGSTIISKVLEITSTEVKYKKFSNLEGPTYTLLKSEIQGINYENGEKDTFTQDPRIEPAQEMSDDPDDNNRVPDRMHMGIRAGSSLSLGDDIGGLLFVQGGFGFDYQIASAPLFLETGLQYMNKGQIDHDYSLDENHCFFVPVLLSYHANIGPNTFLQPFIGFTAGFSGTRLFFDAAGRVGLGFNFGRLYSNIGFDIGIIKHTTDIYDYSTPEPWFNHNFFISVGVNFMGRR